MDNPLCVHFNRINHCQECEANMYTAKVVFQVETKLGVVVEDSIRHVDYQHAERWVRHMGDKIKNATIIY